MPGSISREEALRLNSKSPMAFNAAVKADKETQSSSTESTDFSLPQFSFLYIHYEIIAPTDANSGLATGAVRYFPFYIVRNRDEVTPLLMHSLINNLNIPYLCFQSRTEQFELIDAHTVSIKYYPIDKDQNANGPFEEIGFNYRQIKLRSPVGVRTTGTWG